MTEAEPLAKVQVDLPAYRAALPFTLRRKTDVIGREITSTKEKIHGLLRLGANGLTVQWRVHRSTDRVGTEIRTDREIEPVREVRVPLEALGGASVRWLWWRWPPGRYLVLTASDLQAFEEVAGAAGLELDHPAEMVLPIRREELLRAREFAVEVEMAAADRALREAEGLPSLPRSQRPPAGRAEARPSEERPPPPSGA